MMTRIDATGMWKTAHVRRALRWSAGNKERTSSRTVITARSFTASQRQMKGHAATGQRRTKENIRCLDTKLNPIIGTATPILRHTRLSIWRQRGILAAWSTTGNLSRAERAMPKVPQVALLIETSRAYGRGVLLGINGYLRAHGPWSIYVHTNDLGTPPPKWLKNWNGDGILARIEDREMAEMIRQTGLPAVDLRFSVRDIGFPHVGLDNRAVVKLAFQHLANCGFRQFGFFGLPPGKNLWMDLRRELFERVVVESGFPCDVFDWVSRPNSTTWEDEQVADRRVGAPTSQTSRGHDQQ